MNDMRKKDKNRIKRYNHIQHKISMVQKFSYLYRAVKILLYWLGIIVAATQYKREKYKKTNPMPKNCNESLLDLGVLVVR